MCVSVAFLGLVSARLIVRTGFKAALKVLGVLMPSVRAARPQGREVL
jgi:hypothetical protein